KRRCRRGQGRHGGLRWKPERVAIRDTRSDRRATAPGRLKAELPNGSCCGLVEAMPSRLDHLDVDDPPALIDGDVQDDAPLNARGAGLGRILGIDELSHTRR